MTVDSAVRAGAVLVTTALAMDVFNLNGDEWDHTEDRPGWQSKAARWDRASPAS